MRTGIRAALWTVAAAGFACPTLGCSDSPAEIVGPLAEAGVDSPITSEKPQYDKAFPQDKVMRIDITMSAADWEAMLADMTDQLGAFGSGGGMVPGGDGGDLPPFTKDGGMDPFEGGMPPLEGGMPPTKDGGMDPFEGGMPPLEGGGGTPGQGGSVDLIPRTPLYVECTVATEDLTLRHVGIRFKGNSSLAMAWQSGIYKMPLRLNFDRFEDSYPETKNQKFYGFQELSLSNGQSDRSLLRDKLGTEVFARAGLPSPASAFYRVFVDHGEGLTYFGLYAGLELPQDDSFLDTHFSGHKGNLYKPDGVGARWQTYDEATLGKENHEEEADFTDAKALFEALQADRSSPEKWRAGLEARLDVDGFLHWLALNTVVQDWDSYGQMAHNYYLYADPHKEGVFRWIPWDHSYAFTADRALSLSLSEVTQEWPLLRYLLDDPVYLETYRKYLAQAASTEYEPESLQQRFQEAHDLIAPYVVGTEGERQGFTFLENEASFEEALVQLKGHAQTRSQEVKDYLGK